VGRRGRGPFGPATCESPWRPEAAANRVAAGKGKRRWPKTQRTPANPHGQLATFQNRRQL